MKLVPTSVLLLGLAASVPALAEAPPADVISKLQAYDPKTGDLPALLQAVAPKLATLYLKLGTTEIQRGEPLAETLGPGLLGKIDASPGSLPMVVYKKEEGRLPSAYIIGRYRGVQPAQMVFNFGERSEVIRHPLVTQYWELTKATETDPGPFGERAKRKTGTSFFSVDMPFGAGLFGLRPSYVLGEWEYVTLPNGIAIASFTSRPARPDEQARLRVFKDKKDRDRTLEDDYYQVREYRLTSLLFPERDPDGQVRNTIQVYFVRIVPALKPGTTLQGSGALARWIFARGAQDALVVPVKLTREAVERRKAAGK